MKRKIQWVFIDLDGTLLNSLKGMYQIYLQFLKEFKVKGTMQGFQQLNGPSLFEIVSILKKKYSLAPSKKALLDAYKKKIIRYYKHHVKPTRGAEALLRRLDKNGYKLSLVTSTIKDISEKVIKQKRWNKYFDQTVFGDHVKRSKPNSEIYKLALRKAQVSPKSVLVIEDSVNGVKSAKRAGIKVIGFANGSSRVKLKRSGADVVVFKFKEVDRVLKKYNVDT